MDRTGWLLLAAVVLGALGMLGSYLWSEHRRHASWLVPGWIHLGSPPEDVAEALPLLLSRIGWSWGGGIVEWVAGPLVVDFGTATAAGCVVDPDALHLRVMRQPTTAATALEHELLHVAAYRRADNLSALSREPPPGPPL